MVRGNWQRRVEKAEARKAATKRRKQRRENRGLYKSQVHELFKLIDRHNDALLPKVWNPEDGGGVGVSGRKNSFINETTTQETSSRVMGGLHVWIDTAPSDGGSGGQSDEGRTNSCGGGDEDVDPLDHSTNSPAKALGGKRGGRTRSGSNLSDTDKAETALVRGGGGRKGRGRSNSNVSDGEGLESGPSSRSLGNCKKSGGRNRSNSTLSDGGANSGKQKKKLSHHPRSNVEDEESGAAATDSSVQLMCRRHFFLGTSTGKGDGSSCPHYSRSSGPTLAQILLPNSGRRRKASRTREELDAGASDGANDLGAAAEKSLQEASNAERDDGVADNELTEEDAPHAARMVYYVPIAHNKEARKISDAEENELHSSFSIQSKNESETEEEAQETTATGPEGAEEREENSDVSISDEDSEKKSEEEEEERGETLSISQTIASTLARVDCSIANITYVVLGGALIFDRYRGGLLVRPSEEDALVRQGGDQLFRAGKARSTSMEEDKEEALIKVSLPSHILEYILLFMTDQAVAVFPLVCRAWYEEVGKSSPFLWRHLLIRRGWPLPDSTPATNDDEDGVSPLTLSTTVAESALNVRRLSVDAEDDDDDGFEGNEDDEDEKERVNTKAKSQDLRDLYRESFIKHYSVLRDVTALGCALRRRLHLAPGRNSGGGRKPHASESSWGTPRLSSSLENEAAVLSFAGSGKISAPARWGAGRDGATVTCVALRLWSPTRVLAAYGEDCSLRLYEVARGSASRGNSGSSMERNEKGDNSAGGGGVGVGCRQTVCVRATPVSTSKRRHCFLISMEMDDDYIVCLYDVYGPINNGNVDADEEGTLGGRNLTNTYLTVIRREDFLCSSGGAGPTDLSESVEEGVLTKYDVREQAVNYLFSSSSDGALLRALTEMDNVSHKVHVSRGLSACGSGNFMLELSIQTDRSDVGENNDGTSVSVRHIARKLCLFSLREERIVWMQDLNDALVDIDEHSLTRIASNHRPSLNNFGSGNVVSGIHGMATPSRSSTTVALSASSFDGVFLVDVSRNGDVVRAQGCSVEEAEATRPEEEEEELPSEYLRPVVVTKSHVIVGEVEETTSDVPGVPVIHFYELATMASSSSSGGILPSARSRIELEPTSFLLSMCHVGDDHLLIMSCYTDDLGDDEDEIDGHWFHEGGRPAELRALIVHIPTRVIVGRVVMLDNADLLLTLDVAHILPTSDGDTIALCLPSRGIVLTGSNVRDVGFESGAADIGAGCGGDSAAGATNSAKKKKSQARKSTRRPKKDGFARGMSMRG